MVRCMLNLKFKHENKGQETKMEHSLQSENCSYIRRSTFVPRLSLRRERDPGNETGRSNGVRAGIKQEIAILEIL